MSNPLFTRLLFPGLIVLLLLAGFITPGLASDQADTGILIHTDITLNKSDPVDLGASFIVAGTIKDREGNPVADKSIIFTINGEYVGQARSNVNGAFERKIIKVLNAGIYILTASSNGTHLLAAASCSTTLKVLPAVVQIQTIPPLSGVKFQMDDRQFVSDIDGSASIEINKTGRYLLRILVEESQDPSRRIEFGRWSEESYEPFREIQVPTNEVIQVGLNVYHLVGQSFVDLDGYPIDSQRIEELTIRSAQGDVFVFPDGQPRWIPASRIARRLTGLEETKLLYSVINVTVDGSNVVFQSQQRFYTQPNETWSISLLLNSLHISAKDGLFGFAVGKSVNLEFPDGQIVNYPLDKAGTVEIHSLARGNYFIELIGTNGLSNRTPVALSRDQEVNSKVITYLDLAVAGVIGAITAMGLLLWGRPWLLNPLRNKISPTTHHKEVVLISDLDKKAIQLNEPPDGVVEVHAADQLKEGLQNSKAGVITATRSQERKKQNEPIEIQVPDKQL